MKAKSIESILLIFCFIALSVTSCKTYHFKGFQNNYKGIKKIHESTFKALKIENSFSHNKDSLIFKREYFLFPDGRKDKIKVFNKNNVLISITKFYYDKDKISKIDAINPKGEIVRTIKYNHEKNNFRTYTIINSRNIPILKGSENISRKRSIILQRQENNLQTDQSKATKITYNDDHEINTILTLENQLKKIIEYEYIEKNNSGHWNFIVEKNIQLKNEQISVIKREYFYY